MSKAEFWRSNAERFESKIDPRGFLAARRQLTSETGNISGLIRWAFEYLGNNVAGWDIESQFEDVAVRCAAMLPNPKQYLGNERETKPLYIWLNAVLAHYGAGVTSKPEIVLEEIGERKLYHTWSTIAAVCRASADLCLTLELQEMQAALESSSVGLASPSKKIETETLALVEQRKADRRAIVDPILKLKNWNINNWADECGSATASVYRYYNGESKPNIKTRRQLAKPLGIPVSRLPG